MLVRWCFCRDMCWKLILPSWLKSALYQMHFCTFFSQSSYFLNTGFPEAIAKVLFQTGDLLFAPDQPGALPSTPSQPASTLDDTRENLAWPSLRSRSPHSGPSLSVLPSRCEVLGPPREASLAVHRQEEKVVIRLVEELRSPDNPAEIAHGFSVPQVENKNTPLEYSMKLRTHTHRPKSTPAHGHSLRK